MLARAHAACLLHEPCMRGLPNACKVCKAGWREATGRRKAQQKSTTGIMPHKKAAGASTSVRKGKHRAEPSPRATSTCTRLWQAPQPRCARPGCRPPRSLDRDNSLQTRKLLPGPPTCRPVASAMARWLAHCNVCGGGAASFVDGGVSCPDSPVVGCGAGCGAGSAAWPVSSAPSVGVAAGTMAFSGRTGRSTMASGCTCCCRRSGSPSGMGASPSGASQCCVHARKSRFATITSASVQRNMGGSSLWVWGWSQYSWPVNIRVCARRKAAGYGAGQGRAGSGGVWVDAACSPKSVAKPSHCMAWLP